mmetsp:Transcript_22913/g.47660  ORF Transcript_22913/g.47660 Transcript_22913/m.47660 type:complete len:220 (-) Transcript_22913:486-1145(-)
MAAACASNPVPAPSTSTVLLTISSRRAAISLAASIEPGHITTPNGSPMVSLSDSPEAHQSSIISFGFSTSHIVTDSSFPSLSSATDGLVIPRGTVRDVMGNLPLSKARRRLCCSCGCDASVFLLLLLPPAAAPSADDGSSLVRMLLREHRLRPKNAGSSEEAKPHPIKAAASASMRESSISNRGKRMTVGWSDARGTTSTGTGRPWRLALEIVGLLVGR